MTQIVIQTDVRDVEVNNKLFENKETYYSNNFESKGHVIGML